MDFDENSVNPAFKVILNIERKAETKKAEKNGRKYRAEFDIRPKNFMADFIYKTLSLWSTRPIGGLFLLKLIFY